MWQPKGDFFSRDGRTTSASKSDPEIIDVDFEEKWRHAQLSDCHYGFDFANRKIDNAVSFNSFIVFAVAF